MMKIPLQGTKGRGKAATIDDADEPLVKGRRWMYDKGYAVASKYPSGVESMHRLIMKCTDRNKVVDHINGDRLDNRRENLRLVSRFDNWKHKTKRLIETEHEGILFDPYAERYLVRLYGDVEKLHGQRHHAGSYKTIAKAIKVRDAEVKHGGYRTTLPPRSWDALGRAGASPDDPNHPPDAEKP
jgi:hypothetical protein